MEEFNKRALYSIEYGLFIVTSQLDGKFAGQVANTVMQTSSKPPSVSVCINKENLTHQYIDKSKTFAVSILEQDAPMLFIGTFGFKSGRNIDKFDGVNYKIGKTGCPIVSDYTVATMDVRVMNQMDAQTHTVFVGEVVGAEVLMEGTPLTYSYYRQVKKGKSPKTAPTFQEPETKSLKKSPDDKKYVCDVCGYIYDPAKGDPDSDIAPGTRFEDIPDDWVCPVCGAGKDKFSPV